MEIEKNLNYIFKNKSILEEALTHKSFANENNVKSNEKLEFLGDAILEFISSKYLYNNYPELNEGDLTKARAMVVCEESLYNVALKLNFHKFIKVGKNERMQNGNLKPTILGDSVEAIIASIYFDGGLEEVEKFIIANLKETIEYSVENVGQKDYKTVLQEKLQEHGSVKIEYNVINTFGPDHDKTFEVEIVINGKKSVTGIGKNKKSAEMQAAKKLLGE